MSGERQLHIFNNAQHFESAFWWGVVWLGTVTLLDTRVDISLLTDL